MKVRSAGKTHIGLKRRLNEDSILVRPELGLYVLADGMGGHKAGEVASRMVVDTMDDYWKRRRTNKAPSFLRSIEEDVSNEAKHLINSIFFANAMIHEAQKRPQYHRMGSTVSALLVEKEQIWSANVGDSPVYLFDGDKMTLVSEEHSVEAEQRSMGLMDSFDSTSPLIKNMLTRVLGLEEVVKVYITAINPEAGDVILLCSDGLTNYLSEESIKIILDDFSIPLERKVDLLVDGANMGGGGDNISVILLEVLEEEGRWKKLKKRFISRG
ncbi:MAG: serine/threonine-protein phosphatase [Deltaproteobacteria bacterium]|nr:serine/threonine-protein phosphatase [Deltaproteobacteria bacterium]